MARLCRLEDRRHTSHAATAREAAGRSGPCGEKHSSQVSRERDNVVYWKAKRKIKNDLLLSFDHRPLLSWLVHTSSREIGSIWSLGSCTHVNVMPVMRQRTWWFWCASAHTHWHARATPCMLLYLDTQASRQKSNTTSQCRHKWIVEHQTQVKRKKETYITALTCVYSSINSASQRVLWCQINILSIEN